MALTKISTDGVKDDAVTAGKIPANAVGSSELADNAVDTAAIAANAVTDGKIQNNAVTTNTITNNAVVAAKIAEGSVTTAKIADQAVDLTKLPHGTSSTDGKFLRANNGADPTFETVSSVGGATGVDFNDNVAARFGTGNDFEISHNGSSSIIRDGGSGALTVQNANSEVNLYNNTDNEYLARFINNGANELYYDGSKKLETISNGVQINLTSSDTSGTPDKYLNLYNSNNAVSTMAGIRFAASTAANTDHWIYQKKHSSGNGTDLIIGHGSNERLRFIESGGFTFNGDTAAANALNDYEEGTFSPKIRTEGSSQGEKIGTGTYTKIGNTVTINVRFDDKNCSGLQDGNNIRITNLPFTANSSQCSSTVPFAYNIAWNGDRVQCFVTANNTTTLEGRESRSGGSWQNWASGHFRSSQIYLRFNLTYFTDS